MADYRNLPLKFLLGGINIAEPPELLQQGQLRKALNLRPTTEGVILGRRPSATLLMTQPTIGGHEFSYPSLWSMGALRAIKYIGKVTVNSDSTVPGYMSIHAATPLPTGYPDSTYRVFVNGGVLRKQTGYSTFAVLDPTGISIVRGNTPNGLPVIIVDGQWYILLKTLNLDSPTTTQDINTGYQTLLSVPTFNVKRLGIPKPAAAPTLSLSGTGLTGAYYYRISGYDSTTGFQGPPSAISLVTNPANQTVTVTWTDTNTYGNFDFFRVWRQGGSLPNTWRLLGTTASTNSGGSITYSDSAADSVVALAEALDTDSVEIFNSIDSSGTTATAQKFINAFGPYVGKYVFWVGDSIRKNYIYWNKVADLGRHNPSYDVNAVSDPGEILLNGFIFGNNPFVFSDKRLYALDFGGPDAQPAFIPREVPIGLGAVGRYAYAVAPNMVFLCSKDGIYQTDCQPNPPTNITDDTMKPIFRGESVEDIEGIDYTQADSIRMEATNKELHFLYPGKLTGKIQHLVYDVEGTRWFQWTSNARNVVYANEGVAWNQLLMGNPLSQNLEVFDDVLTNQSESFTCTFLSGSIDAGIPLTHKEWGVLMLDYDPSGANIVITPLYDSETVTGDNLITETVGHSGRRISTFSLDDFYSKNISLQFSWIEEPGIHPILYQALLLFREDEEAVVHWEHPPQGLGEGGLYHVKDGWWGMRSDAPVTVRVFTDGHEDVYTDVLPSTDGVRKRVYMEFLPRVASVWGFVLESSQPFRHYGEDTTLFAKAWQGDNSYRSLSPFSTAGYPPFLRKEGGT